MKIQLLDRFLAAKLVSSSCGLLEEVGDMVVSSKLHDPNSNWNTFEVGNSGSLQIRLGGFSEKGSGPLVTLIIASGQWLFIDPDYTPNQDK